MVVPWVFLWHHLFMDYKSRIRNACENFLRKDLKQKEPRKKRNKEPEREVVREIIAFGKLNKWSLEVYESKASWDPEAGRYRQMSMKAGNPDIMGCDEMGYALYIEVKAPGRLSTFNRDRNYRQKEFIKSRISQGAFACVVDSVQLLESIYKHWLDLRARNLISEAKQYLFSKLP